MNDPSLSHRAVAACAAAMLLNGCGDFSDGTRIADRIPLQAYAPREDVRFNKSAEHLNSSYVYISGISVCGNVQYSYSTTGTAAGLYPGSFTASGGYGTDTYGRGRHGWYFDESFEITSGSVQINGHISFIGLSSPKFYKYKVTILDGNEKIHRAGRAKIEALETNDFNEILHGL
jgi:hypothetical protein